jgi:hypothetical protein
LDVFSSFQQASQVGEMKFHNKIIENVSYCPHGSFLSESLTRRYLCGLSEPTPPLVHQCDDNLNSIWMNLNWDWLPVGHQCDGHRVGANYPTMFYDYLEVGRWHTTSLNPKTWNVS